jgi:pimeloyl-ACP methyl ester carboxylesterase
VGAASRLLLVALYALASVQCVSTRPELPDAESFRHDQVVYVVKPSDTDPEIRHFDEPNYVVATRGGSVHSELAVFMPGTGGRPANTVQLLTVIADQGYRVIGLEYNDVPAVVEVCPRDPSPECSGNFRRERIFGDGTASIVSNSRAESILNRLVKLLQYLDRQHPEEDWKTYLTADGALDWSRIVVSGLSQGAGMAAYIAKRQSVARVVLFSSPWDYSASSHLAPWLIEPSATPPERWFAEYHKRERTAALIARAYAALKIPAENIQVFDLDIPSEAGRSRGGNPFHSSTIHVRAYAPQWRLLFGKSPLAEPEPADRR